MNLTATANNEDQCSRYTGNQSILAACISLYIDTVLTTLAAEDPTRPVWPSCPNEGLVAGVHSTTGLPNGRPLVARLSGRILDTHGPYTCSGQSGQRDPTEASVLFHSEFGVLSLPQFETLAEVLDGSQVRACRFCGIRGRWLC